MKFSYLLKYSVVLCTSDNQAFLKLTQVCLQDTKGFWAAGEAERQLNNGTSVQNKSRSRHF